MTETISQPVVETAPMTGVGAILAQVAQTDGLSRAELVARVGLNRVTLAQRLKELFAAALIEEAPGKVSSGGRPTRPLRLRPDFALIPAVDLGETHVRVAIADLTGQVLIQETATFDLRRDPGESLLWIVGKIRDQVAELGRESRDVLGICLSLPAPVSFEAGMVLGPSVMVGWDEYDIRGALQEVFPVPVFVENDVNLLTLAHLRRRGGTIRHALYVKVGTGIGCGIVLGGILHRGGSGAAGDIGHVQISEGDASPLCRCGKRGCLEAHAAGWAIARDVRGLGFVAHEARDVVRFAKDNVPSAINLVRQSGRSIGKVVAELVSVLNPDLILIGGTLSETGDHLMSGIHEMVHQRCLPLATRSLRIESSLPFSHAGILGCALLVRAETFGPDLAEATAARFMRAR